MEWILLLGAVAFALLLLYVIASKGRASENLDGPWPLYPKNLLTRPEQVLFHRLTRALPEHIVLAQVQVSRVLGIKKGHNFHRWNNRINRLSYDFVVCNKGSAVVAVIELDDSTHQKSSRQEADRRKDKATASAGIQMIRWSVKTLPDQAAIQAIFKPETPLTAVAESTDAS